VVDGVIEFGMIPEDELEKRGGEFVNMVAKTAAYGEMGEGTGEMVDVLVKGSTNKEVSEGRGEVVYRLGEVTWKNESGNGGRKVIYLSVKSAKMVELKVCERGRESVHPMIESIPQCEVKEGGGEGIDWFVKPTIIQAKVGEGRGGCQVLYWG
jgi:hypothetical protein